MLKPIEQRIDESFLLKEFIPVRPLEIRRDDGRQSLGVALIHQAEEGVDVFWLEIEVAEFIDGNELNPAQILDQLNDGTGGEGSIQFVEQILSVIEAGAITVQTSFADEADGDPGIAGALRSDEEQVLAAAQKVQAGQGEDLRLVDTERARSNVPGYYNAWPLALPWRKWQRNSPPVDKPSCGYVTR